MVDEAKRYFFKTVLRTTKKQNESDTQVSFLEFQHHCEIKGIRFLDVALAILRDARFSKHRAAQSQNDKRWLSLFTRYNEEHQHQDDHQSMNVEEEMNHEGHGLSRQRRHEVPVNDKMYIDRAKLDRDNIVEIRYRRSRHISTIRPEVVSDPVKIIVDHMIDHKEIPKDEFLKLTSNHEKHYVLSLAHKMDVPNDLLHHADSYDREFKVLWGELQAGNSSIEIRKKLRAYIRSAYVTGKLSKAAYNDMLAEL